MGFKCGIIGFPNVGKSTLFNALTKRKVKTANFPFCTIEANKGTVTVPDNRLDIIARIVKPKRIVSAVTEFMDVAGLVKNASKGEGLGNQFLSNIRETEAICHVVRCFDDDNIIHVSGRINPIQDIEIINTELALYDFEICRKAINNISKKIKFIQDKKIKKTLIVLEKCLFELEQTGTLSFLNLDKEEHILVDYLNFLTFKPAMYIANINKNNIENNSYFDQVQNFAKRKKFLVIPICIICEEKYLSKKENEKKYSSIIKKEKKFSLVKNLDQIIQLGYKLLNLQSFFTVGTNEIRAWTIPVGTSALQAAGKIHSDFQKGFIRARVISYEDFVIYKGEYGAKQAGKVRFEGKDYIVKDGDIIRFLFNV